jgi:hypothetical protein
MDRFQVNADTLSTIAASLSAVNTVLLLTYGVKIGRWAGRIEKAVEALESMHGAQDRRIERLEEKVR